MLKNEFGLEFVKTGENTYEYKSDVYSHHKITYVPGKLLRIQGDATLEYDGNAMKGRFYDRNGELIEEFNIEEVPDEFGYHQWYPTGFYTSRMRNDYEIMEQIEQLREAGC